MRAFEAPELWLIFVALAAATTLPRAFFIVLGGRVSLPPALNRALRYAPAAALAALIAPDLVVTKQGVDPFNPQLGAALLVVVLTWRWKNPWLPFIAGMAALWVLRYLSG